MISRGLMIFHSIAYISVVLSSNLQFLFGMPEIGTWKLYTYVSFANFSMYLLANVILVYIVNVICSKALLIRPRNSYLAVDEPEFEIEYPDESSLYESEAVLSISYE